MATTLVGVDRVKEWSEESGELNQQSNFLAFLSTKFSSEHNSQYLFLCSYAGDLGPDDVLISTNVDEIMSRFHFFPILPCKLYNVHTS